ncbi:MAG: hypothetical protein IPP90_13085 [Gemmatimonadaceae bacterium]|nr:hypothetical protein [Gemmatimonadaceae bacterium]
MSLVIDVSGTETPTGISSNPTAMTSPVLVYSEFQPLEEVIVGRAYPPDAYDLVDDTQLRDMLRRVARETEEDFERLVKIFTDAGVTVRRPQILHDLYEIHANVCEPKMVDIGPWRSGYPNPPIFPRDLTLTIGTKIINVYSRVPSRWLENQACHDIFVEYYIKGADWISMPPPLLDASSGSYLDYEGKAVLFHAAALMRCGRDVFHTRPASALSSFAKGTDLGLRWIKEAAGPEFRFHPANAFGHLDSKIALLRPSLLLSWLPREALPEPLQSWDLIPVESKTPLPDEFIRLRRRRFYKEFVSKWLQEWIGYVDETHFDINAFSLGPDRVLMNGFNSELFARIRKYGIEPIPFDFRHRFFWDGGLHCVTLDVRRTGGCVDYFS